MVADFYGTRPGMIARRAILAKLRMMWPGLAGLRLLGFGFAQPYLGAFGAERAIAASTMPPGAGRHLAVLCEEDALPFADSFFDRVLLVHALERAEALRPLLRQLWRVLAPEGRILVVAPNRASLWAQVERTPLGQDRPFSRSELDRVLRDLLFEPVRWERALYAPPLGTRFLARTGTGWEKAGAFAFPALAGVHLVEAKKSIYAVTPLPAEAAAGPSPQLTPDFSPSSFSGGKLRRAPTGWDQDSHD